MEAEGRGGRWLEEGAGVGAGEEVEGVDIRRRRSMFQGEYRLYSLPIIL